MAEIDNSFVFEILKKIQADVAQGFGKVDARFLHIEERMNDIEKRLTASMHFEQSVLAHLSSIHTSIAELRAQLTGFDRRVTALEAV